MKKIAIIWAWPAWLTAWYELLKNWNWEVEVHIFEAGNDVWWISKTYNHNWNLIDIWWHRFFSKSKIVNDLRQEIFPIQWENSFDYKTLWIEIELNNWWPDPENQDIVMLKRRRISRIYYLKKFFDYPVSASIKTLTNLWIINSFAILLSYIKSKFIKQKETSLEWFFINRFGKKLYETFFKDYTQKVWWISPLQIKPEWWAQRIKGLSLIKTLTHSFKKIFKINDKNIQTTLIWEFLYPKYGPGQFRNTLAKEFEKMWWQILLNHKLISTSIQNTQITNIKINHNWEEKTLNYDYYLSSMPIKDLLTDSDWVLHNVQKIANKLIYRDFITVWILADKLTVNNNSKYPSLNNIPPDNWIYIQEKEVKVWRLQIFNNWSPYLLKDISKIWLGMEYFCNEWDELWNKSDQEMFEFASNELEQIWIINKKNIQDYVILKTPKAYPAYFGEGYDKFSYIKEYLNSIENLYCIWRNGMHRYNNMDHSMLSAMKAVENILSWNKNKENIWNVNIEEDYQEE